MRFWSKCCGSIVAAVIGSISAAQADGFGEVSVDPAPVAAPLVDWSGLYAGAQLGGGFTDTGWNYIVDSYFTLPDGRRTFDADLSGAIFGGHIVWNRQRGSVVYGAELTLSLTDIDDDQTGIFTPLFPLDTFETTIDGYATAAGRLGIVRNDYLIYMTAGYAIGRIHQRAVSGPPGGGVIADINDYLHGVTVGAGLDYHLAPDVIIGVKYDYVWLDGETNSTATHGVPSVDPHVLKIDNVDIHAVTARLSFKLDGH